MIDYEPFSENSREDPYGYYRELREHAPVYWAAQADAWIVSRYEDVLSILTEPDVFSSDAMGAALTGQRKRSTSPSRVVIEMDPPDHTAFRNIVSRGFTPRRVAALEPRLRQLVRESMQAIWAEPRFDLIEELAIPVPVTKIAELLGVETQRLDDFKRWADEIISFGLTLMVAGNETTTNLIGNMVLTLLDHPEQLEQVRKHPELIPNLIDETLRFESPLQFAFRRVCRETEIAGTVLPKDAIVMPLIGSANRDERRFERADEFDINRTDQGHLTFGFGPHFCMGASLARLEAQVVIEALLEELPRLRRCCNDRESIDSFMIRGVRRLELEWL